MRQIDWGLIWFLMVMGLAALFAKRYEMSVNIFLTTAIILILKQNK